VRRALAAGGAVVLLVVVSLLVVDRRPEAAPVPSVRRVLVVSVPELSWEELRSSDAPALGALVEQAAIGQVSTRVGRRGAAPAEAYLTMGAGTRAVVPADDAGVALDADERRGGVPVDELVARRSGEGPSAIAYLPVGATAEANEHSAFGARIGRLGDLLDAAGVGRAVIANADAAEGFPPDLAPPPSAYGRSAATMLMGADGQVPAGTVGRHLLVDDPSAAFGRRLDPAEVLRSFDAVWAGEGPSVVLVEASDLARATAYARRATPQQADRLRAEAVRSSDELVGELLDRVDPATDAVLVVTPTSASTLGVVALQAPGVEPGLLRSASTRRDGYVSLADAMATVVDLVGLDPPDDIEGRPFEVASAGGDRVARLEQQAEAAGVRDRRLPWVVAAITLGLGLLVLGVARADRLPSGLRRALRPIALAAIGVVPGTFVAAGVPAARTHVAAFVAVVALVAVAVAAASLAAERRVPAIAPMVAVASVVVLTAVDVVLGAPLQVNATFGYSMAVAGRFTGLGNLAFALFSTAAVALAVLAHDRWGSRALPATVALLVAVVVVDGAPVLGADVGGVVATVPAFVLVVLALREVRIGWVHVLGALGAGAAVVVAFGLLDAALPAGSQTHLARFGADAAGGRFGSVATTLWRRAEASFGSGGTILAIGAVGLVVAAVAQARLARSERLAQLRTRGWASADVALAYGVGVLALLGTVANDSSIAVPATMLIVLVPVLVLRRLPA